MFFNGDIIITDPLYITKCEDDWYNCEFGENLEALGIFNYITSEHGDAIGTDIVSLDTHKKLGEFCSDSSMVSIMLLNEVRKYNPAFDKNLGKHCYTIIKKFEGEIEVFKIEEDDGTGQILYFGGKGNINFRTDFFDK